MGIFLDLYYLQATNLKISFYYFVYVYIMIFLTVNRLGIW